MEVIAAELRRIATDPVDADELSRAKENVKGRLALSLESTLTRMNRLGGSVLMGIPILSLDEMVDRIDALTSDDVTTLADELFPPQRLSAAGGGGGPEGLVFAAGPGGPGLG